ncbi:MAG: class I SAM-dependent methyltransferase [Candidatus Amesbacteria bacterium]|nr:class I SAM-dependent methyltransferase [Candidatus Amesbacteria bacterium]
MRRKSHRYRFQLLHEWLVSHYAPQKAADVGGGKGLLAYLLIQSGWDVTVIDPAPQILPRTFKNLQKVRTTLNIDKRGQINRIDKPFEIDMAMDYQMLMGLHSHGSNLKIIDACAKYKKNFILLPCCVIDEPIEIKADINWLESLVIYAEEKGFKVGREMLGFKGQDTIIYSL